MKTYLGDGVYAEVNRSEIALTTENGIEVTNQIVFDEYTLDALIDFLTQNNLLKTRITYHRTDPK